MGVLKQLFGGGMFRSNEARRSERNLVVARCKRRIERYIKEIDQNMERLRKLAVRAMQIESPEQLEMLKEAIRRTMENRSRQERILLSLESAQQIRNQAESMADFAAAMTVMGRSMEDVFEGLDFNELNLNYQRVRARADEIEHHLDEFLAEADAGFGTNSASSVDMSLIEKMIADDAEMAESGRVSQRIDKVREELASHR